MAEGIAQVTSRIQNIEARLPAIEKDIEDHAQWINGNGKEGAKTRLATLEKGLSKIENQLNKLIGWMVGLVLTLAGGFLMYFFTNLLPRIVAELGK